MKFAPHLVVIAAMLFFQAMPAEAQQPAKSLPETKVVLRISRDFIHEVTGKQFERDAPIDKFAFGAKVTGSTHVDGIFDVKLHKSDEATDFDILVSGKISTQTVATTRPVEVHGHGAGTFTGRRRFVFDGSAFTGQVVEMDVAYHSSIDQLRSFRGGLAGTLARAIARPNALRILPEADRQATDEMRTELTTNIEKESDQLMVTINKVGPLLKKGEDILREQKVLSVGSVQHYLAATENHLYLSVGPPGHRIPALPRLELSKRAPIELWIAINKTKKIDLFSPVLKHWDLIRPFVLQRIKGRSPEMGKIIEQVHVVSVDGWHVLTFAPKLLELP